MNMRKGQCSKHPIFKRNVLFPFMYLIVMLLLCSLLTISYAESSAQNVHIDPVTGQPYDFQGKDVFIYDYWTGTDWINQTPSNENEENIYNYRCWLQETYNVKLHQIQRGDWGTCAQEMIDFVEQGGEDGKLALFIVEPGKVANILTNHAAAAWNYDLSDGKWNKGIMELVTIGGNTYGVKAGSSEPRQCLYFNKRVMTEAGINWNDIYDMQQNGTWTWENFENILKQITRDTDGDGEKDVYGLVGSEDDFYTMAVFTNGGRYFKYDDNSNLYTAVNEPETKEALKWAKAIKQKYWTPRPDDSNWDWFKEAFEDGNTGFYIYQAYGGFNNNSEMADMEDDWGCVAFPVCNEGDNYITIISDNLTFIPAIYDEHTVSMLAFIYDMWTNPEYSEETVDLESKLAFTDARAVYETYAMLQESGHGVLNYVLLLGTQNDVLGNSLLWSIDNAESIDELIAQSIPVWDAKCANFNNEFPETVKVMNHEEYEQAELDSKICVETYVQSWQSWWNNTISIYAQSPDGAYFIYNMSCSEADAERIMVPGTKIRVTGCKAEWAGETEIIGATCEILTEDTYVATPTDLTEIMGTEALISHQNEFAKIRGLTVEPYDETGAAFAYKNSEAQTDDLYFRLSLNDSTYDFVVEYYQNGPETEVYQAVEHLRVGEQIDLECFLYWYEGPNPHVTKIITTGAEQIDVMTRADLVLPESTQIIESEAFAGVDAKWIKLPHGLTKISRKAFMDCKRLSQIYIPDSCTDIAIDAFKGCGNLIIYGAEDSYAEAFAEGLGYQFISTQE